jgi:cytosine permease
MPDPAGSPIAPKPWDRGIAPNFITLFLWLAYYDQLGRLALPLGGLFWSALGAAAGGLLCYLLLYHAPAMWGVRARIGFVELSESIFGKAGARRCIGPAIGLAHVAWFAVASYYATDLALRGLVASGFLDAAHLAATTVGGLSVRGPLFLVTSLLWGLAYGIVGVYAVRPVAAIMTVFPLFPALVLGAATVWAIGGLNEFDPSSMAADANLAATPTPGLACATMIQLIFSFFATAALSSPEWGAASRDPRDVRLGGLVGVFCGATILAILGLLIIAGAVGRQTFKQAHAMPAVPGVARGMAPNPMAVPEAGSQARAHVSSDQTTVESILQRGIGGPQGGAMLFILCLGSMAPAVYAASTFGARFCDALPIMPRRRWTMLGTLLAFPLIVLGFPARADLLFGILGALVAPLLGVVTADYMRFGGVASVPTPRAPKTAFVGWGVGLIVGLLPTCGLAFHVAQLERFQPASVYAFLAAFAVRWISLAASPKVKAPSSIVEPPADLQPPSAVRIG